MIDNVTMDAGQLFRLDGRVAMITGASSGLGERFAEVAAANGRGVRTARGGDWQVSNVRNVLCRTGLISGQSVL